MTKVADRPAAELYESDFPVWAERQADLLRAGRFAELDVDRLVEEVADLGRSERHAVMSAARRILEHFLKLEHSPAADPRRGWEETITTQRSDLEQTLTPSLQRDLKDALDKVYARARRDAAKGLRRDDVSERALAESCPYSIDQVLDPDWLPDNRHGLERDGA